MECLLLKGGKNKEDNHGNSELVQARSETSITNAENRDQNSKSGFEANKLKTGAAMNEAVKESRKEKGILGNKTNIEARKETNAHANGKKETKTDKRWKKRARDIKFTI